MKLIFTMLKTLVSLAQSHHKPVVIYRGNKVFKLGEDELHRPPLVALRPFHTAKNHCPATCIRATVTPNRSIFGIPPGTSLIGS